MPGGHSDIKLGWTVDPLKSGQVENPQMARKMQNICSSYSDGGGKGDSGRWSVKADQEGMELLPVSTSEPRLFFSLYHKKGGGIALFKSIFYFRTALHFQKSLQGWYREFLSTLAPVAPAPKI